MNTYLNSAACAGTVVIPPVHCGIPVADLIVDCEQGQEMFDINTAIRGDRTFQLSVTRLDAPIGWGKDLHVIVNGRKRVRVGSSESNIKAIEVGTDFEIAPKRTQYAQAIPKTIFQTCAAKRLAEPLMQNSIHSIRVKNPEYNHVVFTDPQCADVLNRHFPAEVVRAWSLLQAGAYRADLWRYCMLYQFGGVYIDCKMIEHTSLSDVIPPSAEMILVKDLTGSWLYQGFIAAVPGHPLMKDAIDTTVKNVLSRNYGSNPMSISGPAMLGALYNEKRGMKSDETISESAEMFVNLSATDALQRGAISDGYRGLRESPEWMWTLIVKGRRAVFSKCYPGYYNDDVERNHYWRLWMERRVFAQ